MLIKEEIRKHYIFSTKHELDDHNKMLKQYVIDLENKLEQLETDKQKLIEKLEKVLIEYEHVLASEESAINLYADIRKIVKGEEK